MSSTPCTRQRRSSILSPAIENRPYSGSRKGRPTVSLTNSSASYVTNPHLPPSSDLFPPLTQSIIPFPTSPESDSDYLNLLRCSPVPTPKQPLHVDPTHPRTPSPRVSQVELRHRRSAARLAQSPLSRKDAPKSKAKPKDASPPKPRPRNRKYDAQLLATAYRSIASRLARGSHDDHARDLYRYDPEMEAQDRLFMERLCEAMVEPLQLLASRVSDSDLSDSPFLCDPLPLISDLLMGSEDQPVLTMPQLVATIMLRRRERARKAAGRGRFNNVGGVPRGSPLARDVHLFPVTVDA